MFLNGYNATGIKEITDKVKIPKGSFYNHFTNKEDFALEVVQMYCDNGLLMYEGVFLDNSKTPMGRIENFFDRLIKNYSEVLHYKLGCVMGNFSIEMSDINEKFRLLLDTEFDRLQGIIEKCIELGKKEGEIKKEIDSRVIASFFLNSWHGAMLRMKTTENSVPLEDCKEMIISLLKA